MSKRRPYDFIHDIKNTYFKFHNLDWFYPNPGYSEEMTKRYGYKFDGQIFIAPTTPENKSISKGE
jgi:hypothetical protein